MAAGADVIRHLYLHVPFCRSRCPWSDVPVTVDDPPDPEGWLEAVGRELALRAEAAELGEPLETLFVGGGTPSTLGSGLVAGIRELVGPGRVEGAAEWTAEANPEDVTSELAGAWRRAGLTRLVLRIRSFHDPALRFLERPHDGRAGEEVAAAAARSGLPTWGVDLLFGLPARAARDPREDVRRAAGLGAPHISLSELVPEPGTPLARAVEEGEVTLPDPDASADEYLALVECLEAEGYEAYEMTSFARPGHASLHALSLWRGRPYLGVGPGAHSFVAGRRSWNLGDWRAYRRAVLEGRLPRGGQEVPDPRQSLLERTWSRLRLREGAPLSGPEAPAVDPGRARSLREAWIRAGWARPLEDRIALTPEGWLRLDALAVELAGDGAPSGGPARRGPVDGRKSETRSFFSS